MSELEMLHQLLDNVYGQEGKVGVLKLVTEGKSVEWHLYLHREEYNNS